VARAKRTDRAEARRRYRAQMTQMADAISDAGDEESGPSAPVRGKSGRSDAAPVMKPGQPMGWTSSLRAATRPVHYIDDLKYAPTLIFRTNAIWPSALLSVAALAFALTRTDYKDSTVGLLIVYALPSTPLIQPMLAGFLAPRATWLAGLISSVISGACFVVMIIYYTSGHLSNTPANWNIASDQYPGLAVQVLATAVTFGALLGAGSGWYKRFLTAKGGVFGGPRAGSSRGGSQKPVAKRSAARR
jgi:hypothetical protein